MKNSFFILLILAGLITGACRPEPIEIKLPGHTPRLVVASQFLTDNFVAVLVTKSFSSLTGQPDSLKQDSLFLQRIVVEHALVTISYGSRVQQLEAQGGGIYVAELDDLAPGQTYSLYIKDSVTGLECRSAAVMQPQIRFSDVQAEKELQGLGTYVYMKVSFDDEVGIDNHYMLNVIRFQSDSSWRNGELGWLQGDNRNLILMSDTDFKDGTYKGRHQIHVNPDEEIAYVLINISEDYYKFLLAFKRSGSFFNQATGEPIDFPSNVQNGYGYFTANEPDIAIFDLSTL